MHLLLKLPLLRRFMFISIFRLIRLDRLGVTDIAFFEKIFSIDVIHLVFMSCDNFDLVGILSMPLILVLLKLYPDGLGVTIRLPVKVFIL